MTEPLCACGKRPKHKCCEKSEQKVGKMCLKFYHKGGIYCKEQRPQSEWVIDPVFLEGVGDDSELVNKINEILRGEK